MPSVRTKGLQFSSTLGTMRLIERKVITLNFPAVTLGANQTNTQSVSVDIKPGQMIKSCVIKFSFDSRYLPSTNTTSYADSRLPGVPVTSFSRTAAVGASKDKLNLVSIAKNATANSTQTVPAYTVQATCWMYATPYNQ